MVKISTVIMLYNEEEVIDEFSARLIKSLEALNRDYEVIFVVEGTDSTLQKVGELAKWNPRVKVEYHEKRLGLGKAKKKGFSITEVPITFTRRPRGTSKLSFVRSGIGYVILLFRLGI